MSPADPFLLHSQPTLALLALEDWILQPETSSSRSPAFYRGLAAIKLTTRFALCMSACRKPSKAALSR